MEGTLSRSLKYAADFYLRRLGIIFIFSIPFILAILLLAVVAAPTYLALGAVFLRTGSLPELSVVDVLVTAVGYAIAVYLISATIANINIVIRSKRTLTVIRQEVVSAMGTYSLKIFYLYTLMLLLLFAAQVITYENPLQSWLFPLFAFVISFLLFFVPPAIVIDHLDTSTALMRSAQMAVRNPHFVLVWGLLGLFSLSILELVAQFFLTSPFSGYFVLLVNSLIILPFLTVLQTQMYMEKYPLAR